MTYFQVQGYSGDIIRNNLLAVIEQWGPLLRLSFDIKIHSDASSTWSSLVAFKGNGGGGNNQEYGDRIPAIYFNNDIGELGIRSAVSGNKNYPFNYAIDIGTWYSIEIAQIEIEGKVRQGVS